MPNTTTIFGLFVRTGVTLVGICGFLLGLNSAQPLLEQARLRYPVALEFGYEDGTLYTANQRSGSISRIEFGQRSQPPQVVAETPITSALADLKAVPDSPYLLTCDPDANELILIRATRRGVEVVDRAPMPAGPRRIEVHPNGQTAVVSTRWARRVVRVNLDLSRPFDARLRPDRHLDLPFAPHELLYLESIDRWVIGDAFAGTLGILDLETPRLTHTLNLPANNISGLAVQGNHEDARLWVAHQSLNSTASTLQPEVQWGVLMDNHLRYLAVDQLAELPNGDAPQSKVIGLGDETGPGGDPGTILVTPEGLVAVALSGVNRIAVSETGRSGTFTRISVGDRPRDLAYHAPSRRLFVANQFSDTISVIDTEFFDRLPDIALGPRPELTAQDRGEHLFHDASLSLRSWFSCHSCHTDGHSAGLLNDNLGDDVFGTPKRILTLLGVSGTEPLAWHGGVDSLETQVLKSLEKTMHNRTPSKQVARDIAAYLRTLQPPPALLPTREPIDTGLLAKGAKVFKQQRCGKCHAGEVYTSKDTYDVGIVDETGRTEFNPPSLRGVSQRTQWFHDNRADSLEAIFAEHQHPNGKHLSKDEIQALTYFLKTL